ncbi:hypothetical protein G3O08_12345 [Cryomorpha ignava]|uniref:Uncharacterized protein n=1 Tax=Cryomorpha ignava TaxID=101383 RepID=A0A7K3WS39_9FLAO|nr:hypothetical protein [Cryomorpha ignava]NEN24294.1 hypothetical protein [Cryomorpha ignava]
MKKNIPQASIATSIIIFLFHFAMPAVSQVSQESPSPLNTSNELALFTKVIDSKINRNDTEVVRALLENSGHAEMLKSYSSNTLYIMDLDQFEEGMADFEVFGKEVKVLTKYELMDITIPYLSHNRWF